MEPGSLWAGRYRVQESAVQGTTGWVVRARDEEVDVDVALKIVSANLLQTEEDRAKFLKVLRNARKVHHQNVVRGYEDGCEKDQVFYTMPFLEGLTLRKIIDLRLEKGQVFSFSEALPVVAQVASAIDGWQKYGLHGALRPHNIVILPDVLKVTGLAHFQGLPVRPFVNLQTQGKMGEYLAPEARREESTIDRRADIYSLAVIFAEMLTGQVYGRDPAAWSSAINKLPRKLQAVLRRGLAESAAHRFETAAAFFEATAEGVSEVAPELASAAQSSAGLSVDFFDDSEPSSQVAGPLSPAVPSGAPVPELIGDSDPTVASPPPVFAIESRPMRAPAPRSRRARPRKSGVVIGAATLLIALVAIVAVRWAPQRRSPLPAENARVAAKADMPSEEAPPSPSAAVLPTPEVSALPVAAASPLPIPTPDKPTAMLAARVAPDGTPVGKPNERSDVSEALRRATSLGAVAPTPSTEIEPEPKKAERLSTPAPAPAAPRPHASGGAEPAGMSAKSSGASDVVTTRSCPPGMIAIKPGKFQLGTDGDDPMRGFGDLPPKWTETSGYCIDIYEFPNQRGKPPVVGFTWARAKKACESLGKRLCTEEEWERACKGPANSRFPFGNKFDGATCNVSDGGKPAAAGEFAKCRSGYGVADMAGNVAEWTATRWGADVPDKVVKGGAADTAAYTARCAARSNEASSGKGSTLGLRCCADLE